MSRFRVLAAGMTAAVLVALAVPAPASAHDELISSSPAPGEALAEPPTSVTLEFSGEVLTTGAIIVIADAEGTDWVASPAVPDETTVTAAVREGMPDAGYELRWRVVSADGHPISGIVPFTVGDGEPLVRDAEAGTDASAPAPADDGAPESQASQENPALRTVLIGAGGAIAAIALFALLRFLRRRPAAGTDDAAPGSSDEL